MVMPSKHKIFLEHLHNVGPTSKTLAQHCANSIKMICIYCLRSGWCVIYYAS